MKKLTTYILCIFFSLSLNAQEKTWDYPVKPASKQWATFTTGQQMLEACQILIDILNKLSTKELSDICMDYPLFFEYLAVNDDQAGITYLIKNFNGLNELSRRKDGAQELLRIYKDFPVLTEIQSATSKDYDTPYKLPFLELLLSNDFFIKKLSNDELYLLRNLVSRKYEDKLTNSDVYSLHNIKTTLLLGAVILEQQPQSISTEQQSVVKRYIENFNNADPILLTEISKIISEL